MDNVCFDIAIVDCVLKTPIVTRMLSSIMQCWSISSNRHSWEEIKYKNFPQRYTSERQQNILQVVIDIESREIYRSHLVYSHFLLKKWSIEFTTPVIVLQLVPLFTVHFTFLLGYFECFFCFHLLQIEWISKYDSIISRWIASSSNNSNNTYVWRTTQRTSTKDMRKD